MTDRELLELAAKAAGIERGAERADCGISTTLPDGRHGHLPRWNPLEDDGDAFRLLVASPYLDTQWWVTEAWQASNTEEGRRAYLRRRVVKAVASIQSIFGSAAIGQGME